MNACWSLRTMDWIQSSPKTCAYGESQEGKKGFLYPNNKVDGEKMIGSKPFDWTMVWVGRLRLNAISMSVVEGKTCYSKADIFIGENSTPLGGGGLNINNLTQSFQPEHLLNTLSKSPSLHSWWFLIFDIENICLGVIFGSLSYMYCRHLFLAGILLRFLSWAWHSNILSTLERKEMYKMNKMGRIKVSFQL